MTRIGVTGHQKLPEAAKSYARKKIRSLLEKADAPLTGLSSLAAGADQIFAREILDHSGRLWVVIPSVSINKTDYNQRVTAFLFWKQNTSALRRGLQCSDVTIFLASACVFDLEDGGIRARF